MYSDGERKTLSELQREAEMTRLQISEAISQLEEIKKATAKTQFSIDQMFRIFTPEAKTEEEKKNLIDVLMTNSPEVHIECVPLLPIAIAIANGRLTNARSIFAANSPFINDECLIFFTHVLRFSPQATQIDYVDISGTVVTEKGICFILEMMYERDSTFTLVAKNVSIPLGAASAEYCSRYITALSAVKSKKTCQLVLD
ncbi:unnamed protein product [Phytomonas sp. Hart1]|nr:unnamed protein product [Phytomonas sp. Hart1]|eukprot:CCW67098.1 unnamed protein product [Phytomonas sp. isolate Hart1]